MTTQIDFRDVGVFDASRGAVTAHQTLQVKEGRIEWVGPVDEAPLRDGSRVIDVGNVVLLPGLINCHSHLFGNADGTAPFTTDLEWGVAHAIVNAQKTLNSGVTTVRDCGSLDSLAIKIAKMVESGLIVGPRVQAAGQVITMTGGHCHFFGRQVDGPWEVAKAVRAELHRGADCIKIMATGGVLTKGVSPHEPSLELAELEQAARITHNAGKRITSHAMGAEGIKNAIRAGIDSIEHAWLIDVEAIELAVEHGTVIVPTLAAIDSEFTHLGELPTWMQPKVAQMAEHANESFVKMVKAGVKIAAGSDAGTPFNRHEDFARELALMVRLGMPPAQALISATSIAAENLGLSSDLGSLDVGKLADIIVVPGDPTSDIALLSELVLVMKQGEIVAEQRQTP